MVNIICHIVGMNNIIKEQFFKYINDKYPTIIIKDLDIITHKIRNEPTMINLYKKIKINYNKEINKQINNYWKTTLITKLDNIFKKNYNNDIILLGLCTYHKNYLLKIDINTNNKFFLSIDPKKNARDIVNYNIDKYKKNIINGSFPLKYIDYHFLLKQRDRIKKIYLNMGYKTKSLNSIEKLLDTLLYNNNNIFVGSNIKYNKIVRLNTSLRKSKNNLNNILGTTNNKNYIIGYKEEWLAILSTIPNINKYIKKGYIQTKKEVGPFIEEKYENAIDNLKKSCYLYEVDNNFFNKINWYKLKSNIAVTIKNKKYIKDILEHIQNNKNIKIFKY